MYTVYIHIYMCVVVYTYFYSPLIALNARSSAKDPAGQSQQSSRLWPLVNCVKLGLSVRRNRILFFGFLGECLVPTP